MSLRKQLATAIQDHADRPRRWKVYPYAFSPDQLEAPIVIVRQGRTIKNRANPRRCRDTDFQVGLVLPGLDPEKVEDALEEGSELLIDIIESLAIDGLVWSEGTRVTFDDRFHGYDLTVTITNEKE